MKTLPACSCPLSISFQSAFIASSLIYGDGLTPSSWQNKVRMALPSLWFMRPCERTWLNEPNSKHSAVHWLVSYMTITPKPALSSNGGKTLWIVI